MTKINTEEVVKCENLIELRILHYGGPIFWPMQRYYPSLISA